jgi:predicted dinucleotide-binding enzyme
MFIKVRCGNVEGLFAVPALSTYAEVAEHLRKKYGNKIVVTKLEPVDVNTLDEIAESVGDLLDESGIVW